jgi:hypothetical protein
VLTFRLMVRDNQTGGGGVDHDTTTLNVTSAAGPFLVTAPNTAVNWQVGTSQTVSWNVAGTNLSPVSCSSVNILLSTDGGNSFMTTLAGNTPNDGSQNVTVPNAPTGTARVKVECSGNIFFDLSNANFTISGGGGPTPTPTSTPPPGTTMHVGDLDGSSTIVGSRWNASVQVTIHSSGESPVANATVNGAWSNGTTGSGSCVTNASGQCTITRNDIRSTVTDVTFDVTGVTHASNSYQPGSNHDPDGDSDGTSIVVFQEGGPQPTPTPTSTPPPGSSVHVGDIDGVGTPGIGSRWSATVTFTVHTSGEAPVAGATVSGSWSNGTSGMESCVTNASGQCSVTRNNIRGSFSSVTFTVTNVVSAGNTYNAGSNHDPDGSSNGTTIVVPEP